MHTTLVSILLLASQLSISQALDLKRWRHHRGGHNRHHYADENSSWDVSSSAINSATPTLLNTTSASTFLPSSSFATFTPLSSPTSASYAINSSLLIANATSTPGIFYTPSAASCSTAITSIITANSTSTVYVSASSSGLNTSSVPTPSTSSTFTLVLTTGSGLSTGIPSNQTSTASPLWSNFTSTPTATLSQALNTSVVVSTIPTTSSSFTLVLTTGARLSTGLPSNETTSVSSLWSNFTSTPTATISRPINTSSISSFYTSSDSSSPSVSYATSSGIISSSAVSGSSFSSEYTGSVTSSSLSTLTATPIVVATSTNTPPPSISPTTTMTTAAAASTPNPAAVLCGLQGLRNGDNFLALYDYSSDDHPVTLHDCYELCSLGYGYNDGCLSYEFWPQPITLAPRCTLYSANVANVLQEVNDYIPNYFYDIQCPDPSPI